MFGVPWWTVVGEPDWPTAVIVAGTVVFGAAMLGFPLFMYLGHGRRGQDWAARIGDTTLGAIWVLFVWSVIGQVASIVVSHEVAAVGVVVVAVGLLGWGYTEAMRVPRVKRVDVRINGLAAEF